MNYKLQLLFIAFLLISPMVFADEIDDITEPLAKIYDLLKAVVSIVAVIALTVAGAMYLFSGSNIQARESAKGMVSYAIVGLVLVWVAPLLVSYLTVA